METEAALAALGLPDILDRAALEQHFDQLMKLNGAALSRLATSYTNTTGDRDDLLQEIAIALWQALQRFRGDCSERTFLFRIAHNRAIAFLSRNRPRAHDAGDADQVRDPAPDPESGLAREQTVEQLRRAVHKLPLAYRQVVTLALEGLDYSEIASVVGLSETNVGARLTRARQLLRSSLEKQK